MASTFQVGRDIAHSFMIPFFLTVFYNIILYVLDGRLPPWVSQMTRLTSFHVSQSNLEGEFPYKILTPLIHLTELNLTQNLLTGLKY